MPRAFCVHFFTYFFFTLTGANTCCVYDDLVCVKWREKNTLQKRFIYYLEIKKVTGKQGDFVCCATYRPFGGSGYMRLGRLLFR